MTTVAVERLDVRVENRPVRVLAAGSGPAVFLVHGLGLGAGLWRYHLQRIGAEGYRVLAPDMAGFGRSPGPAFGFTVEHAAAWLADLAHACDVSNALWVGHSVSAQYVLRLAADRPDLARALVLAAPTGEPGRLRWLAQLTGLARTAFHEPPSLIRRVLAHYATTPPTRVLGAWIGARRDLALDDIQRVRCPVRIVLGGRDPVVSRSFAERLAADAARGELVVLPESAHGVALEPAEPFCHALLDFAARTSPQRV